MVRAPSRRELIAALAACGECDESGQELKELLVAHSSELSEALRTTPARLLAISTMGNGARQSRVRELLREARQRQQAAAASVARNSSLAAAEMLVKLACREGERVVLDARIVLGRGLLGDRSRRFVCFDAEKLATISVRREKLTEAAKALTFADVTCAIERRGLRFAWRDGRGGLLLSGQVVDSLHAEAVLHVVVPMVRPTPTVVGVPQSRPSAWASKFWGELSVF